MFSFSKQCVFWVLYNDQLYANVHAVIMHSCLVLTAFCQVINFHRFVNNLIDMQLVYALVRYSVDIEISKNYDAVRPMEMPTYRIYDPRADHILITVYCDMTACDPTQSLYYGTQITLLTPWHALPPSKRWSVSACG